MKSNVNMTLDTEVVIEIRKQNLNISAIVNSFLREFTNTEKKEENIILESLKRRIKELEEKKKKEERYIYTGTGY